MGHDEQRVTFTYTIDDVDGPLVDPTGVQLYELITSTRKNHLPHSFVTKAGATIADITWAHEHESPSVAFFGTDYGDQFFEKKKAFLKTTEHCFKDGNGVHFYWEDEELCNFDGKPIGKYHRFSTRFLRKHGTLELDPAYVGSLDFIITSALIMEIHRQQKEKESKEALEASKKRLEMANKITEALNK